MNTSDVVERVVDAHGGLIRWRAVQQLHIDLSSEGLVFATKGQPCALHDVQATVTVAQQQVQLTGTTPRPWSATFASPDALADAVARLRTGSRRWYWRMDDIAAFAATALWAYLALPLLLAEPDVRTEVRPPSHAHSDWDRIDLDFPHRIATHCSSTDNSRRPGRAHPSARLHRDGLRAMGPRRTTPGRLQVLRWPARRHAPTRAPTATGRTHRRLADRVRSGGLLRA